MKDEDLLINYAEAAKFISESNGIEGIYRSPTSAEITEYLRFMALKKVTIDDLIQFVSVYQPDAKLREQAGLNVRVGDYVAPHGGPEIRENLLAILAYIKAKLPPFKSHAMFESLHPFTDCNGRSGRMLWMWQMQNAPLGFLHTWYYQSLEGLRK